MSAAQRTACVLAGGRVCQAYFPGHHMHFIHARKLGESPWGWRDGVIAAAGEDGTVIIDYVLEDGRAEAWHHDEVVVELRVGSPVRVHEGLYALSSRLGWLNILISGGLGPVPTPEQTDPWLAEMTGGVVDLSTGRGLALDQIDSDEAEGEGVR